eukprot:10702524-Prorocentrum_lima.AAC.1
MPDECKFFESPKGNERKGAHPRAPRVPEVAEPTQALARPMPPGSSAQTKRDPVPGSAVDESGLRSAAPAAIDDQE